MTISTKTVSNKGIHVKQGNIKKEQEVKFFVANIYKTLERINEVSKYSRTEYIRDTIMGTGNKGDKKIRLRVKHNFQNISVEATFKFKIGPENNIKTEIEDTVYRGSEVKDAKKIISNYGAYKDENSYEKIRAIYNTKEVEIAVDFYPFGVWVEIEGDPKKIWDVAEKLGFKKSDAITKSADELYLEWHKRHNLPEMWDVKFGLNGLK